MTSQGRRGSPPRLDPPQLAHTRRGPIRPPRRTTSMRRALMALAALVLTASPTFAGYIILRVLLEGGTEDVNPQPMGKGAPAPTAPVPMPMGVGKQPAPGAPVAA